MVVEPRARAAHAPASVSARSSRRSSGPRSSGMAEGCLSRRTGSSGVRASDRFGRRRAGRPRGPSGPAGRSRRGRRRTARPSRSARGPWSRRSRSGRRRTPRRGAAATATTAMRRLAERHLAGPMDDGEPLDPEARRDLVGDRRRASASAIVSCASYSSDSTRPAGVAGGLGLLARRRRAGRRPGSGRGTRRPRRPRSVASAVGELGQDRRRERRLAELEDPARSPRRAAVVRRRRSPAGCIATSSPSASGVVGSA